MHFVAQFHMFICADGPDNYNKTRQRTDSITYIYLIKLVKTFSCIAFYTITKYCTVDIFFTMAILTVYSIQFHRASGAVFVVYTLHEEYCAVNSRSKLCSNSAPHHLDVREIKQYSIQCF